MEDFFKNSNIITIYGNDLLLLDACIRLSNKTPLYYNHIFNEWKELSEIVNYVENRLVLNMCVPAILNNKDPNNVFILCNHDIEQLSAVDIAALVLSNQKIVLYNPTILDDRFKVINLDSIPIDTKIEAFKHVLSEFNNYKPNQETEYYINEILHKYRDLNLLELYSAFNTKTGEFDTNILDYTRRVSSDIVQFIYPTTKEEYLVGFDDLFKWMENYIKLKNKLDNKDILPKGIIIRGIPGSGKTEAAKAIANKYYGELMVLYPGAIYNKYVGASEGNIYNLINYLNKFDDGILLIDEIDKMLTWGSENVDAGVSKRVMGTFLTWLSERKPGLLIIGTTNKFETIPPEMIRRGRFDAVFTSPEKVSIEEMLPKVEQKYGIKISVEQTDERGLVGAEAEARLLELYRRKIWMI